MRASILEYCIEQLFWHKREARPGRNKGRFKMRQETLFVPGQLSWWTASSGSCPDGQPFKIKHIGSYWSRKSIAG
jgi:hypothetical protein